MGCVEKFNPDGGNKFLTYAAPAIRNSMIDYIRSQSTSFEAKHMGEIVSLDEVTKFENRDRHAFVPDSNMTIPHRFILQRKRTKNFTPPLMQSAIESVNICCTVSDLRTI